MTKKVIIFDMDGVIFDSGEIAQNHIKNKYPSLTEEMHKEILMHNFYDGLAKIKHLKRPMSKEEEETLGLEYIEKKKQAPLYDGVLEFLEDLHSKEFILALNTSSMERNCMPLLEKDGIKKFFDFIGTKEVSRSKVEKFKIIREKYNVTNEEMLFVTDTLGDIREADEAGVPTVAVTWGVHDRGFFNLEPHPNLEKVVDTIEELKSHIV